MIAFGETYFSQPASAPFLIRTEDEGDLFVSFVIAFPRREAVPESSVGNEKVDAILGDAVALCPGEEQYEILFESYILYLVRDESYAAVGPEEVSEGGFLCIYEKSHLLDVLPLITDCQILEDGEPYPGKWKHYGIFCLDHIIDVITCKEPTIRKLTGAS